MRRRARIDTNQPEIVAAFRARGLMVAHTHMVGGGFPDVVVSAPGVNVLVEIKDGSLCPSARKLTQKEQQFHLTWPGPLAIVETVADACALADRLRGDGFTKQEREDDTDAD